MAFPLITLTQQFRLTLTPTDKAGNPAPVDGVPVWNSSNEAVATVEPTADGLSALVKGRGVGEYLISVTADADLGEGIVTLSGQNEGTVTQGTAVAVALTAGDVEDQPAEPAPAAPAPAEPAKDDK